MANRGCFVVFLIAVSLLGVCSGDTFLESWMQKLNPVIGNLTILDISLPGAHDAMTGDLSETISDGSNDLPPDVAWVLHEFHDLIPGKFIRTQAKTQGLLMSQFLENGLRFIDFRTMYTAGPHSLSSGEHDWYSLHLMETNQKSILYLTALRDFLVAHPQEIVVVWVSRHGTACANGQDQYPDVPDDAKRKFWSEIETLFAGLLFDTRVSKMNETPINELLARNHRAIFYTGDYAAFTGNSTYAQDSCFISNNLSPPNQDNITALTAYQLQFLKQAESMLAQTKADNRFFLYSMAASAPGNQIILSSLITFDPFDHEEHIAECAALFHNPGMTWCPMYLQDISQLGNYYSQIALDAVVTQNWRFPNAIYIDAVDAGGAIRTGLELFPTESASDDPYATTGYGYVDAFVLQNARWACQQSHVVECDSLLTELQQRRQLFPLTRWDDAQHGRHTNWP